MRRIARLTAILLLAPAPAVAWGAVGHAVTCEVAFQELGPVARGRVVEMVRADPGYATFAEACNWPDHVRGDPAYDWAKPYHFVNVPPGRRGVSPRRDCRPRGCVLAGIERYAEVLRDERALADDRRTALKFLAHFVADVHQPLHVSFAEDRGGTRIGVKFFGVDTNMHALWDSGMLMRRGGHWREIAGRLHDSITGAERQAWSLTGPVEWANESYRIAIHPQTRYAGAPRCCSSVGQAYLDTNLPKVRERLRQGGYRLAATLNAIWPEP